MITGTFFTSSTLDNAVNLQSKYVYDETKTNLPIAVLIHGFNLTIDAITNDILERIASQGYFAVAIGMRGRKGATGLRDASAREIHDIYDGINHIKSTFPVSNKVIVSGYSGGGGNALAFAVKFPFVANTIVNHFGMVDYGFDPVQSWYIRNAQYQSGITDFVGHVRNAQNINYYRSRNAYEALGNIQAKVYSYHDTADTAVSPLLTSYLEDGLIAEGKVQQTKISLTTDAVRYLHNMSVSEKTEQEWLPYGLTATKPSMPSSGTLRVIGYVVTDEFKILLGDLDDHVADIGYDLTANTFTIAPLTGTVEVKIIKGNLQQLISVSETTTFTFVGEETPDDPIEVPQNVKKAFIKQNGVFVPIKGKYYKTNADWKVVVQF